MSKIIKSRNLPYHCSFYYFACASMHDVAHEFACAVRMCGNNSVNILKLHLILLLALVYLQQSFIYSLTKKQNITVILATCLRGNF